MLVVDSSTLFALERAGLIKFLKKIEHKIIISEAVKEEIIKDKSILKEVSIEVLKGKSLKKSRNFENLGIGKGESQCCVLANKLKLNFITCDDRKFIRQRFLNKDLKKIKVLGFSFFSSYFYKKKNNR